MHQLRGDLDWIVMKCLEKDRTRRYETANGLAADLKRHLNNEPVVARPPSAAYKFQKAWRGTSSLSRPERLSSWLWCSVGREALGKRSLQAKRTSKPIWKASGRSPAPIGRSAEAEGRTATRLPSSKNKRCAAAPMRPI